MTESHFEGIKPERSNKKIHWGGVDTYDGNAMVKDGVNVRTGGFLIVAGKFKNAEVLIIGDEHPNWDKVKALVLPEETS